MNTPLHHHFNDGIFRGKNSFDPCARCILEQAAPELLEACQYALDNLAAASRDNLITAPKWFHVQLSETRLMLDSAIQKAENK
jgi:hypothetical protein